MSVLARLFLLLLLVTLMSIVPLPAWVSDFCPAFVFMVWIYIRIFLPEYFSLPVLMLHGLLLDSLLYNIMGQHSFAMITCLWLINNRARRIVFFNLVQQIFLVFALTVLYLYLLMAVDLLVGIPVNVWRPFFIAGSSALVWPWLKITIDDLVNRNYSRASCNF